MLEKLKLVVGLLPLLTQLVKSVEQAIPETGKGQAKLAMVREILEAADATLSASWPLIETLIAALVKGLNATGAFKSS